jgi:oligopeptide transport system ATP-binding protein
MYGGRMAETGTAEDVFADPKHPYTQGLLASVPNIKLDQPELMTMPGAPPDLVNPLRDAYFTPAAPMQWTSAGKETPTVFGPTTI